MSRPCQRCQHHAQADVDRHVCLVQSPARLIPLHQYQARDAACPDWRRTRYPTETDRTQTERLQPNHKGITPCL
jgi:hypothetical protein